jgi:hypothetical protein
MEETTSGRVAKTSWRENKSGGDVELGHIRGFVSAVLGKGLPFYVCSGCNNHLNQPMNLVMATRSSAMVSL